MIIASKTAEAEETVAEAIATKTSGAMTIALESDTTTEAAISEAATIAVHAVVRTVPLLTQIVRAHVLGTADQEVKTEVVLAENQEENAIRSTKLSCILGV